MMRHAWMKWGSLVAAAMVSACGGGVEAHGEVPVEQARQGLADLALSEGSLTAALQATLATGNARYSYTEGALRRFDFTGTATLAQADAAVLALQEYEEYALHAGQTTSYANWKNTLYAEFQPLHPQILSTYQTGSETVQVVTHSFERLVAAGSTGWFRLTILLFPTSHKVIVFEQTAYEV
jgi:hypothetical protein